MKSIKKKAYAKINLFLDVFARYENGYHEVNTVMQTLSLCDDVTLSLENEGILITCDNDNIPCDQKNIAYRAAELYFEKVGVKSGINIDIKKRIPQEAGLGGGSADAAAVLRGLNELFDFPLCEDELLKLGATLGADVPFCMSVGCAYADGIGVNLKPIAPLSDCFIVVAKGAKGVSTPFAYATLDKKYDFFAEGKHKKRDANILIDALENKDMKLVCGSVYNVFEAAILPYCEEVTSIRQTLLENGADCAMMSGSGTAVYGIFSDKDAAGTALTKVRELGYFAELCHPVS